MISWSVHPTIPSIKVRSQVYFNIPLKSVFSYCPCFGILQVQLSLFGISHGSAFIDFTAVKHSHFSNGKAAWALVNKFFYFLGQIPTFSKFSRVGFLNLGTSEGLIISLLTSIMLPLFWHKNLLSNLPKDHKTAWIKTKYDSTFMCVKG